MADLFSGLEKFGLNMKDVKIYEDEKSKADKRNKEEAPSKPEIIEEEYLFDKSYECPICDNKFVERTIRSGKTRTVGADQDLRPRTEPFDTIKYDVVLCPKCGYAALTRYFGALMPTQAKQIKEGIATSFVSRTEIMKTYTSEDALERYQLCLANAIVKRAKASEKAYICLKAGWLLRGMAEQLDPNTPDYEAKKKEIKAQETEYLQNALEGFISARTAENFPMCGMDETTVEYLISALAIQFGKYEVAAKLIGGILTSRTATNRMKDRARDLKDVLLKEMKEKSVK